MEIGGHRIFGKSGKGKMIRSKDISGKKFGKLTAIKRVGKDRFNAALWLCKCECGGEKVITGRSLRNGSTKSCGCLYTFDWTRKEKGYAASLQAYFSYKSRANKRSQEFSLTHDEFLELVACNCYYCGMPPGNVVRAPNKNGDFIYQGIDRIDNEKGYVLENCVPCCKLCNISKNTRTRAEFLEWAEKVHNRKRHRLCIVYCYVCGDILHKGHIEYLKNAKALGDKLIVGVLTDEAVMEKKPRPIMNFDERFDLIRSLKWIDAVIAQFDYSPLNNIKGIKPDILFETVNHKEMPANKFMKRIGGRTLIMPYYPNHSSSKIKSNIRNKQ